MYYVKEIIDDNTVTIANRIETLTIPVTELDNYKCTIVGYNKITKKLKISTIDDLRTYVVSHSRLSGNPVALSSVIRFSFNEFKYELINESPLTVKATISIKENSMCYFADTIVVSYNRLFINLEMWLENKGYYVAEQPVKLHIHYDLQGNDMTVSFKEIRWYTIKNYNYIDVSHVTFSEDTDLSNLNIEGLFQFTVELRSDPFEFSADVDMSKLKIKQIFDNDCIMNDLVPKSLIPPEIGITSLRSSSNHLKYSFRTLPNLEIIKNLIKVHPINSGTSIHLTSKCQFNLSDLKPLSECEYEILSYESMTLDVPLDSDTTFFINLCNKTLYIKDCFFEFVKHIDDDTKKLVIDTVNSPYVDSDNILDSDEVKPALEKAQGYYACDLLMHTSCGSCVYEDGLEDYNSIERDFIYTLMEMR